MPDRCCNSIRNPPFWGRCRGELANDGSMISTDLADKACPQIFHVIKDGNQRLDDEACNRSAVLLDFCLRKGMAIPVPHLLDNGGSAMIMPHGEYLDLFAQPAAIFSELRVDPGRVFGRALELKDSTVSLGSSVESVPGPRLCWAGRAPQQGPKAVLIYPVS